MINKGSIRSRNSFAYNQCVTLRKQGLSYSEIRKLVPVAKSTLQNWLTLSGLTLTREHLEIRLHKQVEKKKAATTASKLTRDYKRNELLRHALSEYERYFDNPLFITGVIFYEAEGNKTDDCRFSNSDHRVIRVFIEFLVKFFNVTRSANVRYSLFVHETRIDDLERIKTYWANKLSIPSNSMIVYWKKNKIARRRNNPDYVGQIQLRIVGIPYLTRKLLLFSNIIMGRYL